MNSGKIVRNMVQFLAWALYNKQFMPKMNLSFLISKKKILSPKNKTKKNEFYSKNMQKYS